MLQPESAMEENARELISRLAAAVMIADEHITQSELSAVEEMRALGLGSLTERVKAEVERAMREPIDVFRTTAALADLAPEAGPLVVSALARIAASDQEFSPPEIDVLSVVARGLGLSDPDAAHIIRSAAASFGVGISNRAPAAGRRESAAVRSEEAVDAAPAPAREPLRPEQRTAASELGPALSILGLDAQATAEEADAAYAKLVRRYNPAAVLDLGPEFAVLAVRKLDAMTAAYVAVREGLGK